MKTKQRWNKNNKSPDIDFLNGDKLDDYNI